jgi:hypothetical protein
MMDSLQRALKQLAEQACASVHRPLFTITARMALSGESQLIADVRPSDKVSQLKVRLEDAFQAPLGSMQLLTASGLLLVGGTADETLHALGVQDGSEILCVRQDPYTVYELRQCDSEVANTQRLLVTPDNKCALLVHRHGAYEDEYRGDKIDVDQHFIHFGTYSVGANEENVTCYWHCHWSAQRRRGWSQSWLEWRKVSSGPKTHVTLGQWKELADNAVASNPLMGMDMQGWSSEQLQAHVLAEP